MSKYDICMDDHVLTFHNKEEHGSKKIKLSNSQKMSIAVLTAISAALPLFIFAIVFPLKTIVSPAAPITPVTPATSITPTTSPSNRLPIIITGSLARAKVNQNYKYKVEGYDPDLTDKLVFSLDNAPGWLSLANCSTSVKRLVKYQLQKLNYISCTLTGKSNIAGIYNFDLVLSDGTNSVVKRLRLVVGR